MQHEILTSEKVPFTFEVAGLGTRLLAFLFDLLLLALLLFIGSVVSLVFESARGGLGSGLQMLYSFAVICGYFTLWEWLGLGQTPGKRLLRIRVISWDGTNVTAGQSVIRNLIRLIDLLPAFFAVGFIAAICTREQRRLGDLAAGTLVVHLQVTPPPLPRLITVADPTDQTTQQHIRQQLQQLTREQRQTILALCHRRNQLRVRVRARLFGAVANFLKTEKQLPSGEFESDEKFVSRLATELDRVLR